MFKNINLKWWQWIFYILGWCYGVFNIAFWIIMIGLHMSENYGSSLFNEKFHRRVYIWGLVMTLISLSSLIYLF